MKLKKKTLIKKKKKQLEYTNLIRQTRDTNYENVISI